MAEKLNNISSIKTERSKINNGIYFHDKTESAVQIRKQDPVIDKANRLRLCRVLCDGCRSGEAGIYYC